jgi:hypothetical protein
VLKIPFRVFSSTPPAVQKQSPAAPAGKMSPIERLEKHLVGRYFYFVYASGTKYRAGRIEAIVADNSLAIRYFNMRSGQLEKWHHVVRMYDSPRIDAMTGFWLYDNETDLKADHGFLLDHIKSQEEWLAKQQDAGIAAE